MITTHHNQCLLSLPLFILHQLTVTFSVSKDMRMDKVKWEETQCKYKLKKIGSLILQHLASNMLRYPLACGLPTLPMYSTLPSPVSVTLGVRGQNKLHVVDSSLLESRVGGGGLVTLPLMFIPCPTVNLHLGLETNTVFTIISTTFLYLLSNTEECLLLCYTST